MNRFPSIIVFGPPGAGKGTLCHFLAQSPTLYHLSSGNLIRSLDPASELGKLLLKPAHEGKLGPDETMITFWRSYVDGLVATNEYNPKEAHLLLDGIPRTTPQTGLIAPHIDLKAIIVLEVLDKSELIERLLKRAKLENRKDDRKEVLEHRQTVYDMQTSAILGEYDPLLIHRFNASQRPLEVVRDVLIELSSILAYPPK